MHVYCWDDVHKEIESRYVPKEFELLLEVSGASNLAKARMIAAWQDDSEHEHDIETRITSCEVEDDVIKATGFFKLNNADCKTLIYWGDSIVSAEALLERDAKGG
jgi:hypothetical protein